MSMEAPNWCVLDQEHLITLQYKYASCKPGLFSLLSPHIKSQTDCASTSPLANNTKDIIDTPNKNHEHSHTPENENTNTNNEAKKTRKRKRKNNQQNNNNNVHINTGIDEEHLELINRDYNSFLESETFKTFFLPENTKISNNTNNEEDENDNKEVDLLGWQDTIKAMQHFSNSEGVKKVIIEPTKEEEIGAELLFNNYVSFPQSDDSSFKALGSLFVLPPNCSFLMSDITQMRPLVDNKPDGGYQLTVMDPPWENKSVHRSSKYQTLPNYQLFKLPVKNLSHEDHAIVAVWVTNKSKFINFVKQDLFSHWGMQYLTTWHWLKVTNSGELPFPMNSTHKKPYEPIIIGVRKNSTANWDSIKSHKTIISVPGSHSRKPCLQELFKDVISPNANCIELFARNLVSGWTSWGNEVLKFQHEAYFNVQEKSK